MESKVQEEKFVVPQKAKVLRLENELRRTKIKLKSEKMKTIKLSSALKLNDVKYKRQQEVLDQQLESLISKLLLLEGDVRREQKEIEDTLQNKDETISRQRQRISRVERINAQLKGEINRLKGKEEKSGKGEQKSGLDTTIKSARTRQLETLTEEISC